MPGRKSAVSTTSIGPEDVADNTPSRGGKDVDGLSVDDLSLPKSMIARLAKGVLPANTQIHKDALLALHKSATVFVSYIASNSNENAQAGGKKTIAPQDVTAALKDAELEGFLPRLEAELKKYNDTQCDKRNTYRRKIKEEKAAAATKDDVSMAPENGEVLREANGVVSNGHIDLEDDPERPVKKLRRENGDGIPASLEDFDDDPLGAEEDYHDALEDEDEDDGLNDVPDEFEDDDDDDAADEVMEDALEEFEDRGELRDEALDEPDSD